MIVAALAGLYLAAGLLAYAVAWEPWDGPAIGVFTILLVPLAALLFVLTYPFMGLFDMYREVSS